MSVSESPFGPRCRAALVELVDVADRFVRVVEEELGRKVTVAQVLKMALEGFVTVRAPRCGDTLSTERIRRGLDAPLPPAPPTTVLSLSYQVDAVPEAVRREARLRHGNELPAALGAVLRSAVTHGIELLERKFADEGNNQ